jgi:phosphatidylglycerophosphatase A
MMRVYKLLATGFGIGYFGKGGGTVAAAVCCLAWYLAWARGYNSFWVILITLAVVGLGVWCATGVEREWGIDNSRVVIDEIAGMGISLLLVPVTFPYIATGFVLFRFFDIAKPLFIRKLEALPGGWGVMLDDVLAGVYTNLILQVIYHFRLL